MFPSNFQETAARSKLNFVYNTIRFALPYNHVSVTYGVELFEESDPLRTINLLHKSKTPYIG